MWIWVDDYLFDWGSFADLSPESKCVYFAILYLADHSPVAGKLITHQGRPVSLARLARTANVTVRKVQMALPDLCDLGLIHGDKQTGAICVSRWKDPHAKRSEEPAGIGDLDVEGVEGATGGEIEADAKAALDVFTRVIGARAFAQARAAWFAGNRCASGAISARYSAIASVSHTFTSPCVKRGTSTEGDNSSSSWRAFRSSMDTGASSNCSPAILQSSQPRSDQEE